MNKKSNIRDRFPLLNVKVNSSPLIYFDNAATTQKPKEVIDEITKYYQEENSNIHRGVHHLSQISTDNFEECRVKVQGFLNAEFSHEIIFTKGTTDSINLVSTCFQDQLQKGDEIII